MPYKPLYIVIDFETEENGHGSTEFYRQNFRVSSAAFSWVSEDGSVKSEFIIGEHPVRYMLERITQGNIPLVAHNAQFEMGVIQCRYPELYNSCIWHADTMRLVQVFDNGGDPLAFEVLESLDDQLDALERMDSDDKPKKPKLKSKSGLGLVKAVKRILELPDHKEEAHEWIHANIPECRKGREGAFLNRLPLDLLKRYNVGDTEATLKLYRYITDFFNSLGYDWRLDHELYFASVKRIVEAKLRGVAVDRVNLEIYRRQVEEEIALIAKDFHQQYSIPIARVERLRLLQEVRGRKTLKGRKKVIRSVRLGIDSYTRKVRFNVGSNKQLEAIFVHTLGMSARFSTAKGNPSFRSAVLHQWGPGGELLRARRKRLLVMKQAESLLALTQYDNRWHMDLKACGTATGRFAGGAI